MVQSESMQERWNTVSRKQQKKYVDRRKGKETWGWNEEVAKVIKSERRKEIEERQQRR